MSNTQLCPCWWPCSACVHVYMPAPFVCHFECHHIVRRLNAVKLAWRRPCNPRHLDDPGGLHWGRVRDGISQRCASLSFIGGGVSLRLSLSILLLLINAAQSDHSAVLRLTSRGKNRKQQQLNYFYISVLLLSLSLCAHFRTLFARVAKLVFQPAAMQCSQWPTPADSHSGHTGVRIHVPIHPTSS